MSVPQSIAYLEQRLSGGAANVDPDAALGSDISSERVLSQSTTALVNITGVTINYAGGNPTGAGSLAFYFANKTMTWAPNALEAGDPVEVSASGKYALFGEQGVVLVTVIAGSLPGLDKTDAVTIAHIANEQFDDVAKGESFTGDTEYRCLYLKNTFVGSVNSITRLGSVATVTTAADHGYASGEEITHRGAVQPQYNGTNEITVTGPTTYTFEVSGVPASPATGAIFHGRPFLSVDCYVAVQPNPGNIAVGVDAAGVGDGTTKAVTSINRTGGVATVVMPAPHSYETGYSVRIAGALQPDYNGVQAITVVDATTFTYPVANSPVTPATGSITAARGVAVTVADENTAPVGVTFSEPVEVGDAIALGFLRPGECVAFWQRRIIPQRNTVTNAETLDKLAFPAYF